MRVDKKPLALAISLAVGLPTTAQAAIEEVIVTAQKREQTLADVPIAVSAFSGKFMEDAQINDAKEVALLTPGVSGDTDDSFLDTINIRGISTNDFGVGAEPSVGVYQDGIYLGRTGGALSSFFDIARVEVVKGPQGTLFGRNASAGAFAVETNKPEGSDAGEAELAVGEDGFIEASGVWDASLTERLSVRGAVYHTAQDGFVTNVVNGEKVGDVEVTAGRLSWGYEGENWKAVLASEYEDRQLSPSIYSVFDPDNTGLDIFQQVGRERQFASDRSSDQMFDEGEVWGHTLTVTADVSENLSFTSITGLRGHNYNYHEDFDGSAENIFNYQQIQEQDYFSQELRLNYDAGGNVTWFVGASIYKEDLKTRYNQTYNEDDMCASWVTAYYGYDQSYISDCASYYSYYTWQNYYSGQSGAYATWDDWEMNGYYNTDYFANSAYYGPGNPARNDRVNVDAEYEGWGIYGDATWAVTDDFDVTVGARYTEDKRDFAVQQFGGPNTYFFYSFPYYTSSPISDSHTWTNFSPRLALNYKIDEENSVYANVSTGYKAGGFNTFFLEFTGVDIEQYLDDVGIYNGDIDASDESLGLGARPERFDEEKVTNYEFGFRHRNSEGTLQLNANMYYYEFEDMQVGAYKNGSIYILGNIGDAEGQGVEMDVRWAPDDHWDIYLGMAFADTELTRVDADFQAISGAELGSELSGTVGFSGALVATYNIPLESGRMAITLETFHQSDSPGFGEFSNDPLKLDGFTTSNLRLGYISNDDWDITLWVTNLTDEFYYKGVAGQEGNLGAHYFGFSEPRRVGLRVTKQF